MSGQNLFLLYTAPNGAVKVDVFLRDETVWLTQKALAELFGVQRPAITKHLGNIFSTGELAEDSVCSILEHTAEDGKNYSAKYYNLDAIIAVGYRRVPLAVALDRQCLYAWLEHGTMIHRLWATQHWRVKVLAKGTRRPNGAWARDVKVHWRASPVIRYNSGHAHHPRSH